MSAENTGDIDQLLSDLNLRYELDLVRARAKYDEDLAEGLYKLAEKGSKLSSIYMEYKEKENKNG